MPDRTAVSTDHAPAAGASLGDAVRCTVYLTDMGDFARVNEVYGEFFEGSDAIVAL